MCLIDLGLFAMDLAKVANFFPIIIDQFFPSLKKLDKK